MLTSKCICEWLLLGNGEMVGLEINNKKNIHI